MAKIYILGQNSFVGKALYAFIRDKENCQLVSRQEIDFLSKETFSNINFDNSIIIDCINVNNGNADQIMKCNYTGFVDFCTYLKKSHQNVKYVYISSISTIAEEIVDKNVYVGSKKKAEDFLISSGLDYQIVRLSYPIGKGENKDRLVSRMIDLLKNNKEINIQDIQINFNDVNEVCVSIYDQLFKDRVIFVSNNSYTSLYDAILFLKKALKSDSIIHKTDVEQQFTPKSEKPYTSKRELKELLLTLV